MIDLQLSEEMTAIRYRLYRGFPAPAVKIFHLT